MQGTAADLIKLRDDRGAGLAASRDSARRKLIMQVHDELVLEVPEAELELRARSIARADGRRGQARRAAAGRGRRRRELGQGALTLPSSCRNFRLLPCTRLLQGSSLWLECDGRYL